MKITNIECIPVQAPGRTIVSILVETDEGITGLGETGLQRRPLAIAGAVESLRKWLIGEDPMRIEHLWQRMYRGGFYPGDRLIGSTIAGIDIALWDIKGQALGVPVYELLGGRCRDFVECFLSLGYLPSPSAQPIDPQAMEGMAAGDHDATATVAKQCVANGHKYFRIGPQTEAGELFDPRKSVRRLIAQLRAAREGGGDELELMIDCHTRLNPSDAIWLCREIEPLGMFVVEDPIRAEYMEGYRHIRQHVNVPLAAGEQWGNKWEFRVAIEEDLLDYIRMDICIAGGLTESKKIANWAETHYIQTLPHHPNGPVLTASALHLGLACNNAGPQEVPGTWNALPDVFELAFDLEGIRLTLPTAPGIGVKFNREAAKAYPGELTEPPHFHREDGSFTNY